MCFTEHLGRWVSDSVLPDCTEGQIPCSSWGARPGLALVLGARSRSLCPLALTWAPPGPGLGRPSGSFLYFPPGFCVLNTKVRGILAPWTIQDVGVMEIWKRGCRVLWAA